MTSILLGNLNVDDIINRLGINITDNEKTSLEELRCDTATNIPENKFHCFDIPFNMVCGSIDVAYKLKDILGKYSKDMKTQIQISVNNRG